MKVVPGWFKFCYASIKATERQAEETEELSESPFDPEESGAMRREVDCKVVMYNKHNDDKHNELQPTTMN